MGNFTIMRWSAYSWDVKQLQVHTFTHMYVVTGLYACMRSLLWATLGNDPDLLFRGHCIKTSLAFARSVCMRYLGLGVLRRRCRGLRGAYAEGVGGRERRRRWRRRVRRHEVQRSDGQLAGLLLLAAVRQDPQRGAPQRHLAQREEVSAAVGCHN